MTFPLPANGGEEPRRGCDRLFSGLHQKECPGAVSALDHTRLETSLAEEGAALVPDQTGYRDRDVEQTGARLAEHAARWTNFGQHFQGYVQRREQVGVPFLGVNVEQHGARGVGNVCRMELASGQTVKQPTIDGAGAQFACFSRSLAVGHVVQEPAYLGAREIGINDQSGLLPDHGL